MSGNYDQIVDVIVTTQNPGVTAEGFGVGFILSHTAAWVERTRTYGKLADVKTDFLAGTMEYNMAAAYFGQDPAPKKLIIGRAEYNPIQVWNVYLKVAQVGKYYVSIYDKGTLQTAKYTSASTDHDTVAAGIEDAINALAAPALDFTATLTGTVGSKVITLTGSGAGKYAQVAISQRGLLGVEDVTPDITVSPKIADDLAACALENNTWYGLLTGINSAAIITAAAGWAETNDKFYLADSAETAIPCVADTTPATDIAFVLKTAGRERTGVFYHPRGYEYASAAEMGHFFIIDPGQDDFTIAQLSGPTTEGYTPTEITYLTAKRCNWYQDLGGRGSIGGEGMAASGKYLDVVRDVDQMRAWYAENIVNLKLKLADQGKKLPFTDVGVHLVVAQVKAANGAGLQAGIIRPGTDSVTAPLEANVSDANKGTRTLPDVNTTWELAGSIHHIQVNVAISL